VEQAMGCIVEGRSNVPGRAKNSGLSPHALAA
jgi:hypothetical protein